MMKRILATSATAAIALTGSTLGIAAPAHASPVVTGGLVNITVVDLLDTGNILSNNNVALGAALGLAANICDVNVNVLAVQLRNGGATCTSTASGQQVTISQAQ
jgi:hypothetical protein